MYDRLVHFWLFWAAKIEMPLSDEFRADCLLTKFKQEFKASQPVYLAC